jgi:hypothetical protein
MKAGDLVCCINKYDGFEVDKCYTLDSVYDCNIVVTTYNSHVYFCKYNNRTCEYRRKNENEWGLDMCQIKINEKDGILSCLGSAACFYDYFITIQEQRKIKLKKLKYEK